MQLSSLDITLQRISMIERQFQSIANYAQKPDEDFQKILNSKIEHSSNTPSTSRAEINNLITKYADKNGLDEDFVKDIRYDLNGRITKSVNNQTQIVNGKKRTQFY